MTPLVPIIGALLAGGDDVVVASGPEAAPIIEKSGARFALAGRSQAEWMERLATRTRGNPGDGLAPERILHYFLPRAFAARPQPHPLDPPDRPVDSGSKCDEMGP